MDAPRKRAAILISGRGSNMLALIEAAEDAHYPVEIAGVISDKADAGGLETARGHGIPAVAVPRGDYASKADHEHALQAELARLDPDIVCLAGFMRLLSAEFLEPWKGRIINIHPSLLPKYKGLDTHERAIEARDTVHGCSVHHVTAGMDDGPVIMQAEVPVLPDDTPETLAARVLAEEHRMYPLALAELARSAN
ncbi:phosphoribosylglycinamide formyltransferase [Oricola cellulosilytica]|uniref:Phosphoribosylglycinamide formyltransferase n=1 Tax=Oricola cellulosilytica TaxID=1429082 RepID=A0A4R0PEJ1_9HYPH|nr:phosphoribosylglycinamide formyltransferase [Oricola cellulosilytica]